MAKLTKETIRGLCFDSLKTLLGFCVVVALVVFFKDKMLSICAILSFIGILLLRKKRVLYYEDGIAWDRDALDTRIYDFQKYFQDPVRRKNLERDLKAMRAIPLGVPLDDNLQPINRERK